MPKVALEGGKTSHNGVVKASALSTCIEGRLVVRIDDKHECGISEHGVNKVAEGSATVFVEGKILSRVGDECQCGAVIIEEGNALLTFAGG